MDYMIFDVRRVGYVVILVRAYTHGGWAHRQRVSTTFLIRKNLTIVSCASDGGFEPRVIES